MAKRKVRDELSSEESIQQGWTPRRRTGPQCKAHRKNGERCKNPPLRGAEVCRYHGGGSKFARAKANERLLEMVMPALNRIRKIILNPNTSDEVALKAAREILNRTGFSERFALTVAPDDRWADLLGGALDLDDDRSGIALQGGEDTPTKYALEKLAEDETARNFADLDAEDATEYEDSRIREHPGRVVDGEVVTPHPQRVGAARLMVGRSRPSHPRGQASLRADEARSWLLATWTSVLPSSCAFNYRGTTEDRWDVM